MRSQLRLYSEERKRRRPSEITRNGKTAEKHGENEATEKSSKQFQAHPWLPRI
jgi:hypothetical protein